MQINNTAKEKRKTGSLYGVVDLAASPVDEGDWFTLRIVVRGKRITVDVDGTRTVDYVEPADVSRDGRRKGRVLREGGGAIALQAHDPESVVEFRSIRVRRLDAERADG